jgi:hypothetical protein
MADSNSDSERTVGNSTSPDTLVEELNVKDKYKPGTGSAPCPVCGVNCNITHEVTAYSESIYCSRCRKKFTREREPLSPAKLGGENPFEIQLVTDEYCELKYKCRSCPTDNLSVAFREHDLTVPAESAFSPIETGQMGYDECSLVCPCGERHDVYFDIGRELTCSCGRVYTLKMDFLD